MKDLIRIGFLLAITILIFSCKKDNDPEENGPANTSGYKITINFEYGADFNSSNIYVIWAENESSSFVQNISICQKLLNGSLTGIALPYWKINVYPSSDNTEVDAVTGATQAKTDFTVSADIKDSTVREFTLYFETDRSFNPNDWFSDQPAILYSAEINLDDNINTYELQAVGWTPNDRTENIIANTPQGILQDEMRYITHQKDGTSFGAVDSRGATKMVEKITVILEKL
jgi:hypothetical protein